MNLHSSSPHPCSLLSGKPLGRPEWSEDVQTTSFYTLQRHPNVSVWHVWTASLNRCILNTCYSLECLFRTNLQMSGSLRNITFFGMKILLSGINIPFLLLMFWNSSWYTLPSKASSCRLNVYTPLLGMYIHTCLLFGYLFTKCCPSPRSYRLLIVTICRYTFIQVCLVSNNTSLL